MRMSYLDGIHIPAFDSGEAGATLAKVDELRIGDDRTAAVYPDRAGAQPIAVDFLGSPNLAEDMFRPVEQTIRLAQNIQVRDEQGVILLRAGSEVTVGTKPGQVDPAWLAHQPMLDLEHERNQKSITKRQAVLTRVRKAQDEAKKRGHHAVQRVGQRERRFGEHGIV